MTRPEPFYKALFGAALIAIAFGLMIFAWHAFDKTPPPKQTVDEAPQYQRAGLEHIEMKGTEDE